MIKNDIQFVLKYYIQEIDESNEEKIIEKLSKIQYEDGRYIFIFKHFPDEKMMMPLVNPNIPSVVGKKFHIDTLKNKHNQLFIKNIIQELETKKESFFQYTYKEPNSQNETTKLSYVYHYEPFDWYIGTGVHLHTLSRYLQEQVKYFEKDLQKLILQYGIFSFSLLVFFSIVIYLFIRFVHVKQLHLTQYENIMANVQKKVNIFYWVCDFQSKKMFCLNQQIEDFPIIKCIDEILQYVVRNDYDRVKKFIDDLSKNLSGGGESNIHFRLKVDGKIKYFDAYTNKIFNNLAKKNELLITLVDITPYKTLEIEHINKQLLNIQSKIDKDFVDFINMIAHQWRHPISYINGKLIDIYLDDFNKRGFIDDIEKTTEFLSETINDFSNIFSNKNQTILIQTHTIVHSILKIFQSKLIDVEVDLDFGLDDKLIGSKSKLQQVLMIVVKNTLDAYEKKQIKNRKLKIKTRKKFECMVIKINDNAGGINPNEIEKVFDIYYTTKEDESKGLGLYMAKLLIENFFHGQIKIKNKKGGLETMIFLPVSHIKRFSNV